ncbi:MAG: diguanylate cyclase (GGDEF)-like protein [Planctomycetota bacterium]|jgi:diguanylate cyclase (GGDEF)-like protein
MKISISSFNIALITGLSFLMFLLWCSSLMLLLNSQNERLAQSLQQTTLGQVSHLQQRQRQWLLSQFNSLRSLIESADDGQSYHQFLWDYRQRNTQVQAVTVVVFDSLESTRRMSCIDAPALTTAQFPEGKLPTISSCRKNEFALIEIVGPLSVAGKPGALIVSMDYFSFIDELTRLSGRLLHRNEKVLPAIEFNEPVKNKASTERVKVAIAKQGMEFGQLNLLHQPLLFWEIYRSQVVFAAIVLSIMALMAILAFHFQIILPLQNLAEKMRVSISSLPQTPSNHGRKISPGLKVLVEYFNAMQKLARRDPLTGLNNRVLFEDRLLQATLEGKRNARKYALVLIKLDEIDNIAEHHGQYIVDAILKQVAERLLAALRETDNVSRFDSRLFAVLMEVQAQNQLTSLVEKLFAAITDPYHEHGREILLQVRFGVAIYPDHSVDADLLYQHASAALLESGQSEWPISFYRGDDSLPDSTGFTLIQSLRQAIEREELMLVFQPVVDMKTHETGYCEVLLRWKDPLKHPVPIERTIQLAEQNHMIRPLSNWIFETACRFIKDSDIKTLVLGINLSMIDLHDRLLPGRLEKILQQYRIKPGQIVIEITESRIMQDPEAVIDVLAQLGVMGMSLSVDDFGTGQASLTYLKEMPVEKLKIDQSFVRDIISNDDDKLIVKATIELAHTLDMKVIAEGVETAETYDLLKEMGCDYVQGYYISKPMSGDLLAGWYEQNPEVAG